MKALIIIDVQNDFMPQGSLPVPEGDHIVPVINKLISGFELVVATQDWHPANHVSFASNHNNKSLFDTVLVKGSKQILWPDHCVQGTFGAELHSELNTNAIETIVRKGTNESIDSYSGFYDNHHQKSTGLTGYLKEKNVDELHFCGLAADFCVYYSMVDALENGFKTILHDKAVKAINYINYKNQLNKLSRNSNFCIEL